MLFSIFSYNENGVLAFPGMRPAGQERAEQYRTNGTLIRRNCTAVWVENQLKWPPPLGCHPWSVAKRDPAVGFA